MKLYIFLMFIFSNCCLNAQQKGIQLNVKQSLHKIDFFTEVDVEYAFNRWQPFIGIGLGTIKTIRQARFYPSIYTGCTFLLIKKDKMDFGVCAQTFFSKLTYNQAEKASVQYAENLIGVDFAVGGRWKFRQQIMAGSLHEHFSSSPLKMTHHSFNFYYSIGLSYVF